MMMCIKRWPSLSLIGLLVIFGGLARAEDEGPNRPYYEMSIEELISINVVTASPFGQTVSEACAIIDVYTDEQIRDLGADNLYEFLSFLPGVEVMETYYGYTDVQFRGILQSHYNNKSSLLVNGQPLYDAIVSSYYLEQIPLSAVKQVEIIRGPGGVLYGTNAYAGVINILTKDGQSLDGAEVHFKGGSFATRKVSIALGQHDNEFDFFLSGEYMDSDGYKKRIMWDEDDSSPLTGSLSLSETGDRTLGLYPDDRKAYENDYATLFTSLGYRDFKVNAMLFENSKDKFGLIPTLASTGERSLRGGSVNLRYDKPFYKDRMELKAIVWHDRIRKEERINSYPPSIWADGVPHDQQYAGRKSGFQTQLAYKVSNQLGLLYGLGLERSCSDPYLFLITDSLSADGQPLQNSAANAFSQKQCARDLWSFLQVSIHPFDKLYFQAGGRVNNNEQAGTITVPSLGAVYRPTNRLAVKCILGSGFRNPSFFEKYARTVNVLAGDTKLEPEKIKTIDFGIDFNTTVVSLRANGFYATTDNLIVRRPLTASEFTGLNNEPGYGSEDMEWSRGYVYYNAKGCNYQGVELSFRSIPKPGMSIQGNFTYKTGEDSDGNGLEYFAPYHANLAVRLSPAKFIGLALTAQYVAEREGNYAATSPWQAWSTAETGGTDYTLEAYTLLNARVAFRPDGPMELSLIVKNLLNEEYVFPEYIRRSIPYIPGGPERSMFVEVGYRL
jgi:outer membrane receptor protein involved in Fe transport